MGRFLKTLNLQNFENNISRPQKVHSYYTRSKTIPSDERTNSSAKPAKKKYILILASSAKIPEFTRDVARKVKRQSSISNTTSELHLPSTRKPSFSTSQTAKNLNFLTIPIKKRLRRHSGSYQCSVQTFYSFHSNATHNFSGNYHFLLTQTPI